MNKKILNTNLKMKEKYFKIFVDMMETQMLSGSKRYALSNDKEFTDLICEAGGEKGTIWVLQTIMKYCGEIINCVRFDLPIPVADFPKIGVYSCIAMIKLWEFLTKEDIGDEVDYSKVDITSIPGFEDSVNVKLNEKGEIVKITKKEYDEKSKF